MPHDRRAAPPRGRLVALTILAVTTAFVVVVRRRALERSTEDFHRRHGPV